MSTPTANASILMKAGLYEGYANIAAKDANTIYFCTDTHQMFLGDDEYTKCGGTIATAPKSGVAGTGTVGEHGKMYYCTADATLYLCEVAGGVTPTFTWTAIAKNYTHPNSGVTAGSFGDTTAQTPAYGATFKVPSFSVNAQGHITTAGEHTVKIPAAPADTGATSVEVTGNGNVITAMTYDAATRKLTATKGVTAATAAELSTHAALGGAAALGHIKTGGDVTMAAGVATVTGVGGKKPATASGLATLDANTKLPLAQIPTGTTATTVALGKHTHGAGDITAVNASAITGTISVENLPAAALERLIVVADDEARLKLTTTTAQNGDTVKVTSTGRMYFVKDDTKLGTEDAFEPYTASAASSVEWSGVTNKPSVAYTLTGDVTGTVTTTLGGGVSIATAFKNSGVTAGTYKSVTVDAKGNVTAGTNPTTLAGYGITDAVPATRTVAGKPLSANITLAKGDVGLGNVDNTADANKNVASAATLTTARKINGVDFNGSADITITAAPTAHALGSHSDVTIDKPAMDQVLMYNGTGFVNKTLSKSDIGLGNVDNSADAVKHVASAAKWTTGRTVAVTGAVTGTSVAWDGSANLSISTTLANLPSSKVNAMTGYTVAATYAEVAAADTLNVAVGKLQKGVTEAKAAAASATIKWGTF